MRDGAPGETRTPDPLLRRSAVQNSKCRLWCRLRANAPLILTLNWTEAGRKDFFRLGGSVYLLHQRRRREANQTPEGEGTQEWACTKARMRTTPSFVIAKVLPVTYMFSRPNLIRGVGNVPTFLGCLVSIPNTKALCGDCMLGSLMSNASP